MHDTTKDKRTVHHRVNAYSALVFLRRRRDGVHFVSVEGAFTSVSVDRASDSVVVAGVSESVGVVGASVDGAAFSVVGASDAEASSSVSIDEVSVAVKEPVLGVDDPLPDKGTQLTARIQPQINT